uniref:Dehydrogenase/reductase 11b, tandem duplicate 2 n=1 Tax=Poecilia formosa TaxID=48698 RepID=A0A087XRN6_POEFO
MDRWKGRVALVTGASVGIGATIAKELVRYGMTEVGCARSLDKIQALAVECKNAGHSGVLIPMKCDLTNAEDIQSMFAIIKAQHKGVDVCINNAGLAHNEPLLSGKTSAWKNMLDDKIQVCYTFLCVKTVCQVRNDLNYNFSCFILFSGVFGGNVGVVKFMSLCEAAVKSLKNPELTTVETKEADVHIRFLSISPGIVETEFAHRFYSETPDKATATYSQLKPLEAIDVANAVVYVLSAPPHVQIGEMLLRPVEQQA